MNNLHVDHIPAQKVLMNWTPPFILSFFKSTWKQRRNWIWIIRELKKLKKNHEKKKKKPTKIQDKLHNPTNLLHKILTKLQSNYTHTHTHNGSLQKLPNKNKHTKTPNKLLEEVKKIQKSPEKNIQEKATPLLEKIHPVNISTHGLLQWLPNNIWNNKKTH